MGDPKRAGKGREGGRGWLGEEGRDCELGSAPEHALHFYTKVRQRFVDISEDEIGKCLKKWDFR